MEEVLQRLRELQQSVKEPVKATLVEVVKEPPKPPKPPKPKRIWDNYRKIGMVCTGDKRSVLVGVGIRDGVSHIVLRDFYFSARNDSWMPSFHGMTVPIRIPIRKGTFIQESYNDLILMLAKAVEEAATMPIADPENAVYAAAKK